MTDTFGTYVGFSVGGYLLISAVIFLAHKPRMGQNGTRDNDIDGDAMMACVWPLLVISLPFWALFRLRRWLWKVEK